MTTDCDHSENISPVTETDWWCGDCESTINIFTGEVVEVHKDEVEAH